MLTPANVDAEPARKPLRRAALGSAAARLLFTLDSPPAAVRKPAHVRLSSPIPLSRARVRSARAIRARPRHRDYRCRINSPRQQASCNCSWVCSGIGRFYIDSTQIAGGVFTALCLFGFPVLLGSIIRAIVDTIGIFTGSVKDNYGRKLR